MRIHTPSYIIANIGSLRHTLHSDSEVNKIYFTNGLNYNWDDSKIPASSETTLTNITQ